MDIKVNTDTAKEALMFLSYFDSEFIKLIPPQIIKDLTMLAADSEKEFYIKKDMPLKEQEISSECKQLIGNLYKTYVKKAKQK